jgi:hypothetical protein
VAQRARSIQPYRVFMGTTRAEGAVQVGLGETIRKNKWGRDRKYVVTFLSAGSPQQPLVEFVAADDYEQTRELVAVIRGSDGGRHMYGVGDALPAVYTEHFQIQIYNERVVHPGAWNKLVVVAREDDDEAMLNHALIQSRRPAHVGRAQPATAAAAPRGARRTRPVHPRRRRAT